MKKIYNIDLEVTQLWTLSFFLQGVFLFDYVILLYVSVSPAQLLILGGVQISHFVSVHESPCNAILDKENRQGYDSNQTNSTGASYAANQSSLFITLPGI